MPPRTRPRCCIRADRSSSLYPPCVADRGDMTLNMVARDSMPEKLADDIDSVVRRLSVEGITYSILL
ncbi:hypothetical protein U9M48_006645 [Paspalum notatum var. saurae]|uniref:Uncharacterized protein n=1 Tax=Paspalum notatum var. saurae TaxID=547442 RepID=A0AAQ3PUV7_PASNO